MKNYILYLSVFAFLLSGCSQNGKDSQASGDNDDKAKSAESKSVESTGAQAVMYPELSAYITSVVADMEAIPQDRKKELKKIALFVETKKRSAEPAKLTFICTHNSRRSQTGQLWASTAAAYYGVEEGISTYSGGTEATAFNPRAVAAMERAGFQIDSPEGENPHYQVQYSEKGPKMECFSKVYDHEANPQENFAAIMTCSEADKNCPSIPGASLRVPIPYVDPKESDGTDREMATYDERCKQIATEMFYIMSQVKA